MSKSLNLIKHIDCDWLAHVPVATNRAVQLFKTATESGVRSLPKDRYTLAEVSMAFDIAAAKLQDVPTCYAMFDQDATHLFAQKPPFNVYANRTLIFFNGGNIICMAIIYTSFDDKLATLDQQMMINVMTKDRSIDSNKIYSDYIKYAKSIERGLDHLYATICPN